MERLAHEREQLVSQALPEHLKMVAVATGGGVSLGDVIRLQGKMHAGHTCTCMYTQTCNYVYICAQVMRFVH